MIVLLGARLNWMLHFGLPPRFAKDVAFIQVDINAEELTRGLALQGKFYNTLKICTKIFREIIFMKFCVKLISHGNHFYEIICDIDFTENLAVFFNV